MKDTYCDYCNSPNSTFNFTVCGYTNSDISVRIEDDHLNIDVLHYNINDDSLIYDGSFMLPILYCPKCGKKVGMR